MDDSGVPHVMQFVGVLDLRKLYDYNKIHVATHGYRKCRIFLIIPILTHFLIITENPKLLRKTSQTNMNDLTEHRVSLFYLCMKI